jgi:hypothetical protein
LRSMTFDSPSKTRRLSSIPSPCTCSIHIPDSLEVLNSVIVAMSDDHLLLSFGIDSRLCDLKVFSMDEDHDSDARLSLRTFVRLSQPTLRVFRFHLSSDSL